MGIKVESESLALAITKIYARSGAKNINMMRLKVGNQKKKKNTKSQTPTAAAGRGKRWKKRKVLKPKLYPSLVVFLG